MTKDLRLKIYPAVIAILGFSLVALLLSRLEIQVSREPAPGTMPSIPEVPSSPAPSPLVESSPLAPSPTPQISPSPQAVPSAETTQSTIKSKGQLRISNQTSYPVRVALLYQASDASASAPSKADSYGQPVHWDFAPTEGGPRGLIVSLPSRSLRLQAGDVLVAFAQDGSRRYWGPYVVGKTTLPTWNTEQKEWSLVLQP